MSILIKGMELPKSCFECPWRCKVDPEHLLCRISGEYLEETFSGTIQNRHKSCPLVEIPPHGRLGDLDKLENGLRHMAKYQHGERQQGILGCCETIRLAHTIIPAEEGE